LERISTLKDFLRWLVLREQFEIEQNVPEAQRFAHRWNIFPYEGAIFVGIVTGLTGKRSSIASRSSICPSACPKAKSSLKSCAICPIRPISSISARSAKSMII
jgi:hypothetical protein